MAENASNDIKYFILINKEHKSDLAGIRLWNNLKIAFDEDSIWVKDLDYVQVNSLEVKSIPYKSIYYEQHGKLFPQNSRLPERNVPALLWTPIDRALPIQLPGFNHNYFGINQTVSMNLIPRENEMEAEAMITSIDTLEQYIETAPAIRLQKIKWAILNNDKVFLTGTPLLPITGETYWKRNQFILPSGFDFELFSLSDAFNTLLNEDNQHLIIWNTDNTYALLHKDDLKPLSIGSFRMTMKKFISETER